MAEAVEPLAGIVPKLPPPDPELPEPLEPVPLKPVPLELVARGPEAEVVALAPDPVAPALAPALAALPTPAGIPGEPLSTPLAVATREVRVVAVPGPEAEAEAETEAAPKVEVASKVDAVPEPEATPEAEAAPVAEVVAEADMDFDEEDDESDALQERSYRGVVDSLSPTIPKLGEGVSGAASWRVYQKTLVFPNRGQPTSSQYVLALSMEATARFWSGPLTGQPVSVTQTSFPPTAACVWV